MMRRLVLILTTILVSTGVVAQNAASIKEDPSLIWAEGNGDSGSEADISALEGLVRMLAATDIIPVSQSIRLPIWQTYLSDIRRISESVASASGSVIRYIPWSRIPDVFDSRRQKVRELCDYAEQAAGRGEFSKARTYCGWAETYIASLPLDQDSVRERLASLRKRLGNGETSVVSLRNVETEVQAIRRALSLPVAPRKPVQTRQDRTDVTEQAENQPTVMERSLASNLSAGPEIIPYPVVEAPVSPVTIVVRETTPEIMEPERPRHWSIMALTDIDASPSLGLMLTSSRSLLGAYTSIRSNLIPGGSSYSCQSDGTTDFGFIWVSGNARLSRWTASAGATVNIAPSTWLFAGGGYGDASLLWEDDDNRWARVSDLSVSGIAVECGLIWRFHSMSVAAGVSTVGLKHYSALLVCGWTF